MFLCKLWATALATLYVSDSPRMFRLRNAA
jgi:hypothetical protein